MNCWLTPDKAVTNVWSRELFLGMQTLLCAANLRDAALATYPAGRTLLHLPELLPHAWLYDHAYPPVSVLG